jgi:hypothetical protein
VKLATKHGKNTLVKFLEELPNMKASSLLCFVILIAAALAAALPASAEDLLCCGRGGPWDAGYYDPAWGMPLSLVVPPTVHHQSNYAWGVGGSRVERIHAKYRFEYPGPASAYNRRDYLPAPPQPTDTTQFGVNYVRGPR